MKNPWQKALIETVTDPQELLELLELDHNLLSQAVSASKLFRVGESRSFQIRVDATNVLNHPTPGFNNGITTSGGTPTFSANSFGVVNTKTGERSFQGQLRVNF